MPAIKPLSLSRVVMGGTVLVGLVVWPPLAYVVGGMMVLAGLTGTCLLESFFGRLLGRPTSCSPGSPSPAKRDLRSMDGDDIKQAVGEKYSAVALKPGAKFNFPVGRKFAESVGYPAEALSRLPATMWESFTGAGNPQGHADPRPGDIVLDLGCGAGLDLYFYANAAGDDGRLYGLDISRAMLDKARQNLEAVGIHDVAFLNAPADAIPLPDASVDLVTANGIYNLSPDKDAVMREVFRVLKPGGRTVFAEIVLKAELPREIRKDIDDWFRCIGGALTESDFLARLRSLGFRDAQFLWKGRNARTGHKLAVCAVIRAEK